MDVVAQPSYPAVSIINSLRAQRGRLRRLEYRPLEALQQVVRPSALQKVLIGLEAGLREVLHIADLQDIGTELAGKASHYLESLCQKLEGLVNPRLVPPGSPKASRAASSYMRLKALVDILERDNWQFDLIVGDNPDRTLFQAASQEVALEADRIVDELNTFFKRLHQPSLRETQPSKRVKLDKEELDRASRLRNKLRAPFETLLQTLQQCAQCGPGKVKEKEVLVQLEDLARETQESVQLFLSSDQCPRNWHEVQLVSAPSE